MTKNQKKQVWDGLGQVESPSIRLDGAMEILSRLAHELDTPEINETVGPNQIKALLAAVHYVDLLRLDLASALEGVFQEIKKMEMAHSEE